MAGERRGGNVFNVLDYGADPSTNTDSAAAIRKTIAAAAANASNLGGGGYVGSIVYFPPGNYRYYSPIAVTATNVTIRGAGRNYSRLAPLFFGGAHWYQGPSQNVPTLVAGITSSGGSAVQFTNGLPGFYQLRDAPGGDFDGRSALTVEFFYKPTSIPAYDCSLLRNGSKLYNNASYVFSLSISQSSGGPLSAGIITSDGSYSVGGPSLVANTQYHIALSWNGTTLRLFVDGTQTGSIAATGTLVQRVYDDFIMGTFPSNWPEGGTLSSGPEGIIDSLRISNTALYTSNFTKPTTKLSNIGSTLALVNFDAQIGPFTQVKSQFANTTEYLCYRVSDLLLSSLSYTNIEDISWAGGGGYLIGPIINATQQSHYRGIQIDFGRTGLLFRDNCYETELTDYRIYLQGYGDNASRGERYGLAYVGASSILDVRRVHITGGGTPFVVNAASSGIFNNIFIETGSRTKLAAAINNDTGGYAGIIANQFIINDEAAGVAPLDYAMIISTPALVSFTGLTIGLANSTATAGILINGGDTINFTSTDININAATPEIIKIDTLPNLPVSLTSFFDRTSGAVPLTTKPEGLAIIRGSNAPIVAKTSAYTIKVIDMGITLSNEGATSRVDLTLPSAAKSLSNGFYIQNAVGMRIIAASGDTIRIGASVSATAGYAQSTTAGSWLILTAQNGTEWVAKSVVGNWGIDI